MNTNRSSPVATAYAAAVLLGTLLTAYGASAQPQSNASVAAAAPHALSAPAPTPDIHDIRGPKPISSPWLVPLIAATTLLAMGGAYAAWAWNRRRYREASKRPLDLALERLEQARGLMEPPRGREFSIEVSSAVRDYIETRFDVRAAHLTTDEFLHQLLEPVDSPLSAHRSKLDHFLQTCDLAKFGGWNLGMAEMEALLTSAREFIVAAADETQTRPQTTAAPLVLSTANRFPTSTSRETYVSLPSA